MKKFAYIMLIIGMCAMAVGAFARPETKSQATVNGTEVAVNFGPRRGQTVVKSIFGTTDLLDAKVSFFTVGGAGSRPVLEDATNGATLITLLNTGNAMATGDLVMVKHDDGSLDYRTVWTNTLTNITLATGISSALTEAGDDRVYEMVANGQIVVGFFGTGVGTNDTIKAAGEALYATPGDSPLRATLNGTTNISLTVTVND